MRLAHLRLALSPGIACDAGLAVLFNCSQFEMAKTRRDSSGEKQGLGQIQKKTRTSHTVETDQCTGSGTRDGSQKLKDSRGVSPVAGLPYTLGQELGCRGWLHSRRAAVPTACLSLKKSL